MNETVKQFARDKSLTNAVYEYLLTIYLKPRKGMSTEEKAASWIAVERLQEAWRNLERLQDIKSDTKEPSQPGL